MEQIIPKAGESLHSVGKRCGALYICPKDSSGKRTGKLVPYAGKDSQGRNLVGDIYFNFRRVETHLQAVMAFVHAVFGKLCDQNLLGTFDTICGIPHGGRTFGMALAMLAGKRFVYADKKPKPTEPGRKQEYYWDLSQFEFEPGERVAVAEDIFNNMQNTDQTLEEIAATGAVPVLLVGALNRSPVHDSVYTPKSGRFAGVALPIVASIRQAYPEYEQDDPAVAADMAAGNIEWEVKKNWDDLMAISARS